MQCHKHFIVHRYAARTACIHILASSPGTALFWGRGLEYLYKYMLPLPQLPLLPVFLLKQAKKKKKKKKKKITYTKEPLAGQLSLYNPRTHTCVSHFSSPPCKSPVKLNLYFILVNIYTPSHPPNNPTGNSTNSFIAL